MGAVEVDGDGDQDFADGDVIEEGWVLVRPGDLQLRPLPLPDLEDDEVLLRMDYASVQPMDGRVLGGECSAGPAAIPGVDGVGTVVRSRCGRFAAGDRAAFVYRRFGDHGSWRRHVVLSPARMLAVAVPVDLEPQVVAAGLASTCAALACLRHFRAGDTLVVSIAAGAVGLALVQLAALRGLRVAALLRGSERLGALVERCGALGAVGFVDCAEEGWEDLAAALVGQGAEGEGADGFVDGCGGELRLAVAGRLVRVQGTVVLYGAIAGEAELGAISAARRLTVFREGVSSFCPARDATEQLEGAIRLMARGDYRPGIWQLVGWRDAPHCLVKQPMWGRYPSQLPGGPGGGRRIGRIILKMG